MGLGGPRSTRPGWDLSELPELFWENRCSGLGRAPHAVEVGAPLLGGLCPSARAPLGQADPLPTPGTCPPQWLALCVHLSAPRPGPPPSPAGA